MPRSYNCRPWGASIHVLFVSHKGTICFYASHYPISPDLCIWIHSGLTVIEHFTHTKGVTQNQSKYKGHLGSSVQGCKFSGNFLISGNFARIYPILKNEKLHFSGNFQAFKEILTKVTCTSEYDKAWIKHGGYIWHDAFLFFKELIRHLRITKLCLNIHCVIILNRQKQKFSNFILCLQLLRWQVWLLLQIMQLLCGLMADITCKLLARWMKTGLLWNMVRWFPKYMYGPSFSSQTFCYVYQYNCLS